MNEELREEAPTSIEQQESQPTNEQNQNGAIEDVLKLEQRLVESDTLAKQYKDQLLRKAAEFENYKKRIENDFSDRVKYANEDLIFELLPVLDDFERSLKSGKEKKDFDTLYRGIELISQKMLKVLEIKGIVRYESKGKPFDPHLHDALLQVQNADVPPHTVLDEVEVGYMMHGKVLRHAKVIVSAEPQEAEPQTTINIQADEGGEA